MAEATFDFMKIWTQGDQESEFKMKTVLLDGLDSVVQAQSDVLSKIKLDRSVATPVVRWMEEWGYPSTITARLTGNNLAFSGHLFGQTVNGDSVRKVIRGGTILERPRDGCQVKISSVDGLSAAVTATATRVWQMIPDLPSGISFPRYGLTFEMLRGLDRLTGHSVRSAPRYSRRPSRSPKPGRTPSTRSFRTRLSIKLSRSLPSSGGSLRMQCSGRGLSMTDHSSFGATRPKSRPCAGSARGRL